MGRLNGDQKIGRSLKEIVFGFNDGLVSNVALITGVAAGTQDIFIVILAGFAEMIATCISMGLGEYISMKSQNEYYQHQINLQNKLIKTNPKKQKKALEKIYKSKGLQGNLLKSVINKITSNKKTWSKTLTAEKIGIVKLSKSPKKAGVFMSIAALIGGLLPLIPFLTMTDVFQALKIAVTLSICSVFIAGSLRCHFTGKHWFRSGMENTLVAGIATLATYGIGTWFHGLF